MNYGIIAWLAALIAFAVLEAATVNLVSIWFIGGSLAGLITAACGGPVWLQLVLFVGVSALLLACLRPFLKKYVNPKKVATNADRNIGKTAVVTERIDNVAGTGAAKVNGVEWTARTADGSTVEVGALVTVQKIEGVKLCVVPTVAAAQSN
jgi:membrane protein implicated in regulation of membrane protease activity